MSNIPFNTVASVLGSTTVARQLASAQDKKVHEQIRSQRQVVAATELSREEVDDPGNHDLQQVHDEDKGHGEQKRRKRRPTQEQVDIEGIEVPAQPPMEPPPASHLDISA